MSVNVDETLYKYMCKDVKLRMQNKIILFQYDEQRCYGMLIDGT